MSLSTLARVLCALIAFQLAVGLQPAIANATATAQTAQAMHSAGEACPTHALLKHDCCKSSGCQCHCGSLPLAVTPSSCRATLDDTMPLRPTATARAPSALADGHFRPPIAASP